MHARKTLKSCSGPKYQDVDAYSVCHGWGTTNVREKLLCKLQSKDNEIGDTKLVLIRLTCLKEEKTVFFYSSH